jgi:hypothetical protein
MYVGGPGNMVVQYDTEGDCRMACISPAYAVLWDQSIAASEYDRLIDGKWVPQKPPEPATERFVPPSAATLAAEGEDVLARASRGEEGLSISLLRFNAIVAENGYSTTPSQRGDRLYIWRHQQYSAHLPMMPGNEIDAAVAAEYLEKEGLYEFPKVSV